MAVKTIANTNYYKILFDEAKNRIYYTVKGYWPNVEIVPNYLNDIQKVLDFVQPHFTMVVHVEDLEAHPDDVEELRKKAQVMAVKAGMYKAAEIVPRDMVSDIQFDMMTETTKFEVIKVGNRRDADKWLDKQVELLNS